MGWGLPWGCQVQSLQGSSDWICGRPHDKMLNRDSMLNKIEVQSFNAQHVMHRITSSIFKITPIWVLEGCPEKNNPWIGFYELMLPCSHWFGVLTGVSKGGQTPQQVPKIKGENASLTHLNKCQTEVWCRWLIGHRGFWSYAHESVKLFSESSLALTLDYALHFKRTFAGNMLFWCFDGFSASHPRQLHLS